MQKILIEAESTEFEDQNKKRRELEKKAYEARMTRYKAEEKVKFVEEGLKAARLDNLREIVKRAALIKIAQEEV